VVFAVNGRVTGAEVYGSNALFLKVWPKLLRSAAADAVAQKTAKATPAAPSAGEVERFLALAGSQDAGFAPNADLAGIPDGVSNGPLTVAGMGPVGNEIRGRSGSTRSQTLRGSGGNASGNANPTADWDTVLTTAGSGAGRIDEQQLRLRANEVDGQAPAVQLDNVQQALRVGNAAPAAVVVNTPGNRLNVNRVEDGAGLVSESRDPGRQNAVIHRSYIKK
jgi:hypothetical protein